MWGWLKWPVAIFKKIIRNSNYEAFLRNAALTASEAATRLDLDGDGKVETLKSIAQAGREFGVAQLEAVAGEMIAQGVGGLKVDPNRVRRYFVMAQIVYAIADRFGAERLPMFRLIRAATENAFVDRTAEDVMDDLIRKGVK